MEDKKAASPSSYIEEVSEQLEGVINELFAAAAEGGEGWTNVHDKKGVAVDVKYKEGDTLASARTKVLCFLPSFPSATPILS